MNAALLLMSVLAILAVQPAPAQTFTVVHNFTGGTDGATPMGTLTTDGLGALYGTTIAGGANGLGTVFRLARSGDTWEFYALYAFDGLNNLDDGISPFAGVVIGPDGLLYGTTHSGGDGNGCMEWHGCGTVFDLKPGRTVELWDDVILHRFGSADGSNPDHGDLLFGPGGDIYGTTRNGGDYQQGAVYKMISNRGGWTETVLHSFGGSPDGASPLSELIIDQQGNLYGTTSAGGANGWGAIFRLKPSGSGWSEDLLYSFTNGLDGITPAAGLVLDGAGNLYGATQGGGTGGGGTIFELAPSAGDTWNFSTIANLQGTSSGGPNGALVMDAAGNLYGTTSRDGAYDWGSVFHLTLSNGAWTYHSLHDFTGGMDGGTPDSSLVFDANGNLYGTASAGGASGQGVIFEIAPQSRSYGRRK
jgi:uncharacterized repeat protein (TIGR03803 family)